MFLERRLVSKNQSRKSTSFLRLRRLPTVSKVFSHASADSHKKALWELPNGFDTGIKVFNSLSNSKVPLVIPTDEKGAPKKLMWYSCGPTVYDRAHLGHAR